MLVNMFWFLVGVLITYLIGLYWRRRANNILGTTREPGLQLRWRYSNAMKKVRQRRAATAFRRRQRDAGRYDRFIG